MATPPTKLASASSFRAKVTSKGQITVPVEIRRSLGVKPGDSIRFEQQEGGIRVLRETSEAPLEKLRGIGIPGVAPGREGVMTYMRELRGYDEYDDSIA